MLDVKIYALKIIYIQKLLVVQIWVQNKVLNLKRVKLRKKKKSKKNRKKKITIVLVGKLQKLKKVV